jgi:predicted metal-dependent HD superfamily phosphohydrolase
MTALVNYGRWSRACIETGVAPDEADYRRVRRGWSSMGRHYHTLSHLEACLRELDEFRALAVRPAEVELALWFHDVVYRTWRKDNEAQSAALAEVVLRAAPEESVERIRQAILATCHREEELGGDTALVVDIDLAILGATADEYARFERAIRREYWWVPRARYVAGRGRILRSFLERATIYQHDAFHERYEARASENMTAALRQLEWK